MIKGWRVLVLNADGSPLQVSPWEEIIHLPLEGLATVQEWASDESGFRVPLHGGNGRVVIDLPSVIQVKNYVRRTRQINFCRHAVYQRDDWTCVYCGEELSWDEITIDHCIPRHILRGDASTWGNTATCCKACNSTKGGMTLGELKSRGIRTHNGKEFKLSKQLVQPSFSGHDWLVRFVGRRNLCWLRYLQNWRDIARRVGREWLIEVYDEWEKAQSSQ